MVGSCLESVPRDSVSNLLLDPLSLLVDDVVVEGPAAVFKPIHQFLPKLLFAEHDLKHDIS